MLDIFPHRRSKMPIPRRGDDDNESRKPGICTSRQMTPEERERVDKLPPPQGRPPVGVRKWK
ncbi:hypothetical protein [Paenibacillus sp. UMB4589-SE434]|uniref:hypothetical protein n=1 Tax=Paenibacillus sp. UMB4589-SE434 TaxID=3046314 RepID=UPI00254E2EC0|nr:hypothetical protein [Paenibacillus sp. UMB4589-SE434]MDK8182081.1 hypothetical protein [Paenibacillus sp. UMB4589-SE434]